MNDDITTTANHHEVADIIIKQQPGQAGHDGQQHLRTRRMETRVSPEEHATICARALSQGFGSVTQYVRQQALHGSDADSPFSNQHTLLVCQAELSDIPDHVNQIARHLTDGEPLGLPAPLPWSPERSTLAAVVAACVTCCLRRRRCAQVPEATYLQPHRRG